MLDLQKTLELVEAISTYSAAEGVEMDLYRNRKVSKQEKEMARALLDIYKFVHAKLRFHKEGCKHPEWLEEAKKRYEIYLKNNLL